MEIIDTENKDVVYEIIRQYYEIFTFDPLEPEDFKTKEAVLDKLVTALYL